jgi:hypothetical protein
MESAGVKMDSSAVIFRSVRLLIGPGAVEFLLTRQIYTIPWVICHRLQTFRLIIDFRFHAVANFGQSELS